MLRVHRLSRVPRAQGPPATWAELDAWDAPVSPAENAWPPQLEDLTPGYLQEPLMDPYAKAILRYRPAPNGFTYP